MQASCRAVLLLALWWLPLCAENAMTDSNLRETTVTAVVTKSTTWTAFETARPADALVTVDEPTADSWQRGDGPADTWVLRRPGWTPALLNARGQPPDLTLDPQLQDTCDIYLGLRAVTPTMTFGIKLDNEDEFSILTAPAATATHHYDFEFFWKADVPMAGRTIVLHSLGNPVYVQYLRFVQKHETTRTVLEPIEHSVVMQEEGRHFAFPAVAQMGNGDLLAVCREGDAHVCPLGRIVIARSTDGGRTWSPRQVLFDSPSDERDPAILRLRDGTVVVSYNCWDSWRRSPLLRQKYAAQTAHMEQVGWGAYSGNFLLVSQDDGRTWSEPRKAPLFSPHGPVQGPDGALYWVGHESRDGRWIVVIHRTADLGVTWERYSEVAYCALYREPLDFKAWDEPNLLFLPDGKAIVTLRVELDGYVYQAYSSDAGKTWSWPQRLDVWGFPQQLCALADGRVLMAYGYRREPYGIRACLSADGGHTWDLDHEIVLRHEGGGSDLGYPYSIQLQDGRVYTVYYYNTEDAKCFIEGTWYRP